MSPENIDDETKLIDVTSDVPMTGNTWISPVYYGGTVSARTRMLTERVAADMAGAVGIGDGGGNECGYDGWAYL